MRGKKRDRGGAGAAVVQAPILGLDRSRNHSYCHSLSCLPLFSPVCKTGRCPDKSGGGKTEVCDLKNTYDTIIGVKCSF